MSGWPDGLTLRSIRTWPTARTPERERRSSPFRAPLSDTLALLRRELRMVRATDVAMEIALPGDPETNPTDWRNDGKPRAHARPDHPGVVVVFSSPVAEGQVRVATDRFVTWQDNLRAIAKTLEHQRAFERYGTAMRGEQYAGFAQITAGGPDPERGRALIERLGGLAQALRATHPDTRSGEFTDADFADVQAARAGGS